MTHTSTTVVRRPGNAPSLLQHDGLLDLRHVGPMNQLSADDILARLPSLPTWPKLGREQNSRLRGATAVLDWLSCQPGAGWQERWLAADGDNDLGWMDKLGNDALRSPRSRHLEAMAGFNCLLLRRAVLPSYHFLASYRSATLYDHVSKVFRPDLFAQVDRNAAEQDLSHDQLRAARAVLAKMVLHVGRNIDQLTAEDLYEYRAWKTLETTSPVAGLHTAWELLRDLGLFPVGSTLRGSLRPGPRSSAELLERYQIQCAPIRDVLVRYLDERRGALDYNSLRQAAGVLAGTFWADIEKHHPGLDTLLLPVEVAEAWKERLKVVTTPGGGTHERLSRLEVLVQVRAFYLDIQEWAHSDPTWARWAVRSPVREGETAGVTKRKRKSTAVMHQRVRDRLPVLPVLVDAAERHRAEQDALLRAASAVAFDATFDHEGTVYRRVPVNNGRSPTVAVVRIDTGTRLDLTADEDAAFWAWAIIETLRHTGIRVEELLELSHLALVSYKLPGSGEIVPLLQIVPSKSDEERLLLVSPELASVLATIVTRLRRLNGGTVPLVARYDPYEAVTCPPLPHLFQRRIGSRREVTNRSTVRRLLTATLLRTGLTDAAGTPLHYSPHDFRRIFATDAVGGGLPVHIVARLLGHSNINTTQAYLAVFQEDLVQAYRSYIDQRRQLRPEAEYREPTDDEWREFQQHFELRKLELGTCTRPYGTPCKHEHACIRCPSLRLDLAARPRLVEVIENLKERIQEARMNGWLGEVSGLQVSVTEAVKKLVSLDRSQQRARGDTEGPTDLGMPIIAHPR